MTRVQIDGNEKWVGFIGGGYSGNNCSVSTCDTSGKGFYVIDLMNGNVLWSYTHDVNNALMDFDLAANPAVVDSDSDGFADTVYIGDLGGNVWRFTFCMKDAASCGQSSWVGEMLFSGAGVRRPIFYMNAVTRDTDGNLWVHFGTGDKTDPTFLPTDGTKDRFFAVIDKNRKNPSANTLPFVIGSLKDITSSTFTLADVANYKGWVMNFQTPGEKMLSESTVFQGSIYFTTYTPGSSDPCEQGGTAKLYAINYLTGGGLFNEGVRSSDIGSGIPSAPIVSIGPSGSVNVYVSTSQTSGTGAATTSQNRGTPPLTCPVAPCPPPPDAGGPGGLLYYWRDLRLP